MAVYFKENDIWNVVDRPYFKRNNLWTPVKQVYVKGGGIWNIAYTADTIPPAPPEISLQLIDRRYIKVGLRIPGAADGSLRKIRLLASRTEQPKSPDGTGFISDSDDQFPNEEWSEWYYNNQNPAGGTNHGATNDFDYKQYPVNPTDATNLPADKTYYFSAWGQDKHGLWSSGTFAQIHKPKAGVEIDKVIVKEAKFQPNFSGSAGLNGAGYVEGDLVQQETPRSNGFWFYSTQFNSAVGEQGTPTVRNAEIRVIRADDLGVAEADVNLFWHAADAPGDMPVLDADRNDITTVGTINKGQSKWFPVPASYLSKFNTQLSGFGLAWGNQASDFMVAKSVGTTQLRCGEVNVVWEEAL